MTSDFVLPTDGFAGAGFGGGADSEANPSSPSAASDRIGTTLGAAPSVPLSSLVPDDQRCGFALLDIGVLERDLNATSCHNDITEIRPYWAEKTAIRKTFVCEVYEQIEPETSDFLAILAGARFAPGSAGPVSA
jgi:hypothetical protein